MQIANNILRHYLRNVYFITGTACAGKSTTVKMLAEQYGMRCCGENYHAAVSDIIATPDQQPDICYLNSLTDWKDFVTRSPEEYARWVFAVGKEAAEFEVTELIAIGQEQKVIVDTNIPLELLHQIAQPNHVAVMVSPTAMSVERFFDREDPEKQFLLQTINSCDNPEAVMENYKRGLALINSQENYDSYINSGFFTIVRDDTVQDTRQAVCDRIARHFGLC